MTQGTGRHTIGMTILMLMGILTFLLLIPYAVSPWLLFGIGCTVLVFPVITLIRWHTGNDSGRVFFFLSVGMEGAATGCFATAAVRAIGVHILPGTDVSALGGYLLAAYGISVVWLWLFSAVIHLPFFREHRWVCLFLFLLFPAVSLILFFTVRETVIHTAAGFFFPFAVILFLYAFHLFRESRQVPGESNKPVEEDPWTSLLTVSMAVYLLSLGAAFLILLLCAEGGGDGCDCDCGGDCCDIGSGGKRRGRKHRP